jgi:acetyltransferase EpsM
MTTRLIIIGGGEHARVVAEAARSNPHSWQLKGFVDPEPCVDLVRMLRIPRLGSDAEFISRVESEDERWVVLGIGAVRPSGRRRGIVETYQAAKNLKWAKVFHSAAWISPTARIEEGVVVFAGAVVNSGAHLGVHSVVNTGAIIEHDVRVGAFVMVSPGVVIGGGAVLEEGAFVGLGARIRDHVTVGVGATVAMGAVVVKDVPAGQAVEGIPAKTMKSRCAG